MPRAAGERRTALRVLHQSAGPGGMRALGPVLLFLAGCATTPIAPVDSYLTDLSAKGLLQGAVVIGRNGRIEYARGFGFADVERAVPFTPETPSDGGSMAKTLTAAAILKLVGEGRVDLDAPVQRYVAEYPHAATRVRHLITHTAGLPNYDWLDKHQPPPARRTNADQVALLVRERVQPAFLPGTRFEYDNTAYDVAAMVVESASGQSYANRMRDSVFSPLGMRSAFVRPARLADFAGTRTRGYRRLDDRWVPFDAFEGEAFHGGGNVYLSALDLHAWAGSFLLKPILERGTLERGLRFARLDDGRETGLTLLNWYRSSDGTRFYYTGNHEGVFSFAYWDRERGLTVSLVTNNGLPNSLKAALPRALIALGEGRPPEPLAWPPRRERVTPTAAAWNVPGIGRVIVRLEGRRPYLGMPSGVEYAMIQIEPGVFATPGLDAFIRFEEGALVWDSVFLAARGTPG